MQVVFTKINSHKYSSVAMRSDGVCLSVPGFGTSRPLPHDIIHFVTEHELGLEHGFWGSVAAGAVYRGMAVLGGRVRHDAEKRSREIIRTAGEKLPEAEHLAATVFIVLRDRLENDWPKIQALQKSMWQPARPGRSPLAQEEVKRICARLRRLGEEWASLADSQTLTLMWNVQKSGR